MEEQSEDLILNIDFDQTITDDLIDSIGVFDIQYNTDYEVGLSENLRIKKLSGSEKVVSVIKIEDNIQ